MKNSLIKSLGESEIGKRESSFQHDEPEPLKCIFCENELKFRLTGSEPFKYWVAPKRCECEKAKQYWSKYDEQTTLIEKEIEEFKENEEKKLRIEKLIGRSSLGRRFLNRTFDTFEKTKENEPALKKAYNYAINFPQYEADGKGLILTGNVGTGKTHLVAAIANYLIFEKYISVKFGNVTTLLGEIKNTYSDEDSQVSEGDLIYSLSKVRLLIIDDLGKEKCTDWSNNIIYTIINNRYEDYKPIIVTTNLSIRELENNIGSASVSRLIEMCEGIKMDGVDFRKTRLISNMSEKLRLGG